MYYVIYLDVFFMVNFLMDLLILLIVGKLLKCTATHFRSVLAAIFGAAFICIMITKPLGNQVLEKLITYFGISFGMVRIAYGMKGLKNNLKAFLLLYLVTFLFGGIMNALYYYSEFGSVLRNVVMGTLFPDTSIPLFLVISIVSFVILKVLFSVFMKHREQSNDLYEVRICYQDREIRVKALVDTGNSLREPVCNRPVHVIEFETLKVLLDESFQQMIYGFYNDYDVQSAIYSDVIKVIPFHSLGKTSGIILGIKIDHMYIAKDGEEMKVTEPILGIYNQKLSHNSDYQMLIHPEVMNN